MTVDVLKGMGPDIVILGDNLLISRLPGKASKMNVEFKKPE